MLHPRQNEKGQAVTIHQPHVATPPATWTSPDSRACVAPQGTMVDELNGVPFATWAQAPATLEGWEALAADATTETPPFAVPSRLQPAAGVVVQESDGRIWVVAPTNAFGGYAATFPKGRLDGLSPQAAAIREAWEESGLKVRLIKWLVDAPRSTTFTRYFLAERVGGTPADMGWESQAVMLVPSGELRAVATHANDAPIIAALEPICDAS